MRKSALVGALILACSAQADEPSFDFIDVLTTRLDVDAPQGDPDEFSGYKLAGAYQFNDEWFVAGEYSAASEASLDQNVSNIGVGYIFSRGEDSLWYVQANYTTAELQSRVFGGIDDNGLQFDVGYRLNVSNSWEVQAALRAQTGIEEEKTLLHLASRWMLNDDISFALELESESDSNRLNAGIRVHF